MADVHVLYRFYSQAAELLYVGLTCSPSNRFAQHRSEKDWWGEVANIGIAMFPTREALQAAERDAIKTEKPRYNVLHNGQRTFKPVLVADSCLQDQKQPLVGKFFHTTRECGHGARIAQWQGRIVSAPAEGVLLIQLYEWIVGEPSGQELITVADFVAKKPVIYDTAEDWRFGYDYGVLAHSSKCRKPTLDDEEAA